MKVVKQKTEKSLSTKSAAEKQPCQWTDREADDGIIKNCMKMPAYSGQAILWKREEAAYGCRRIRIFTHGGERV